eukprot:TRINITY_DN2291_c0_g1_i1.p1 TRINITY_DN2291_c0_g1~~TRINITY_DN2291_c0_g1_i1.p1  ORF type:complete len:1164 (+),score=311.34 TRINITY_DN2291_c0_g1_i1:156-3647(+)
MSSEETQYVSLTARILELARAQAANGVTQLALGDFVQLVRDSGVHASDANIGVTLRNTMRKVDRGVYSTTPLKKLQNGPPLRGGRPPKASLASHPARPATAPASAADSPISARRKPKSPLSSLPARSTSALSQPTASPNLRPRVARPSSAGAIVNAPQQETAAPLDSRSGITDNPFLRDCPPHVHELFGLLLHDPKLREVRPAENGDGDAAFKAQLGGRLDGWRRTSKLDDCLRDIRAPIKRPSGRRILEGALQWGLRRIGSLQDFEAPSESPATLHGRRKARPAPAAATSDAGVDAPTATSSEPAVPPSAAIAGAATEEIDDFVITTSTTTLRDRPPSSRVATPPASTSSPVSSSTRRGAPADTNKQFRYADPQEIERSMRRARRSLEATGSHGAKRITHAQAEDGTVEPSEPYDPPDLSAPAADGMHEEAEDGNAMPSEPDDPLDSSAPAADFDMQDAPAGPPNADPLEVFVIDEFSIAFESSPMRRRLHQPDAADSPATPAPEPAKFAPAVESAKVYAKETPEAKEKRNAKRSAPRSLGRGRPLASLVAEAFAKASSIVQLDGHAADADEAVPANVREADPSTEVSEPPAKRLRVQKPHAEKTAMDDSSVVQDGQVADAHDAPPANVREASPATQASERFRLREPSRRMTAKPAEQSKQEPQPPSAFESTTSAKEAAAASANGSAATSANGSTTTSTNGPSKIKPNKVAALPHAFHTLRTHNGRFARKPVVPMKKSRDSGTFRNLTSKDAPAPSDPTPTPPEDGAEAGSRLMGRRVKRRMEDAPAPSDPTPPPPEDVASRLMGRRVKRRVEDAAASSDSTPPAEDVAEVPSLRMGSRARAKSEDAPAPSSPTPASQAEDVAAGTPRSGRVGRPAKVGGRTPSRSEDAPASNAAASPEPRPDNAAQPEVAAEVSSRPTAPSEDAPAASDGTSPEPRPDNAAQPGDVAARRPTGRPPACTRSEDVRAPIDAAPEPRPEDASQPGDVAARVDSQDAAAPSHSASADPPASSSPPPCATRQDSTASVVSPVVVSVASTNAARVVPEPASAAAAGPSEGDVPRVIPSRDVAYRVVNWTNHQRQVVFAERLRLPWEPKFTAAGLAARLLEQPRVQKRLRQSGLTVESVAVDAVRIGESELDDSFVIDQFVHPNEHDRIVVDFVAQA